MATIVNDRIDVRISREQKELVKYASELKGFKSLSEFIVFCINREATTIIQENNQVLKTLEDKKLFLNALLNPPKANAKLKKAQVNYQEFIKDNEGSNTPIK